MFSEIVVRVKGGHHRRLVRFGDDNEVGARVPAGVEEGDAAVALRLLAAVLEAAPHVYIVNVADAHLVASVPSKVGGPRLGRHRRGAAKGRLQVAVAEVRGAGTGGAEVAQAVGVERPRRRVGKRRCRGRLCLESRVLILLLVGLLLLGLLQLVGPLLCPAGLGLGMLAELLRLKVGAPNLSGLLGDPVVVLARLLRRLPPPRACDARFGTLGLGEAARCGELRVCC